MVLLSATKGVPKLMCNFLSTSKMQKNGWKVIREKYTFRIENGNTKIIFNKKILSLKGQIFGIKVTPRVDKETKGYAMVASSQKLTYKQTHSILGHPGQQMVMATAKRKNWIIDMEGKTVPFQSCLIRKAKREVINKESNNKSTIPGEQLMIDIISVCGRHQDKKKAKGNFFWVLVVDKATSMKWFYFPPQKD